MSTARSLLASPLLALTFLFAAGCAPTDAPDSADDAPETPLYSEQAMVVDLGLDGESDWFAVNDTVMGGVSTGSVAYEESWLRFEGEVSTDSNGGFTSVRSRSDEWDLSGYDRVLIRMRSEGQPFSFNLATSPLWFEGNFQYAIDSGADWEVVEIPMADFEYYDFNRGYPIATGEMLEPADREEVYYVELMSELFEPGPFVLEVDWIAFD